MLGVVGASVGRAAGALSLIVLGRLLSPTDFAEAGIAATAAGTVGIIASTGFSQAAVASARLGEKEITSLTYFALALNAVVAITICVTSPLLAGYFGKPELAFYICGASLVLIPAAFAGVVEAKLQREMRFGALAWMATISATASAGAGMLIATIGGGPWALILPAPVATTILAVAGWRLAGIRISGGFQWKAIEGIAPTGFSLQASRIVQFLADNVDYVVLGRCLPKAQFGLYYFGYERSRWLVNALDPAMTAPVYPALVRVREIPGEFRECVLRTTVLIWTALTALEIPLVIAASVIIPGVFGEKWRPATVTFQWLSLTALARAAGGPSNVALLATHRARFFFFFNLIRLIPTAVVVLILAASGATLETFAAGIGITTVVCTGGAVMVSHLVLGFRLREMVIRYGPGVLALGVAVAVWLLCPDDLLLVERARQPLVVALLSTIAFVSVVVSLSNDVRSYSFRVWRSVLKGVL